MEGLRTGVVLGAGASSCYEDGEGRMPLQRDIASSLFMGLYTSSPQIEAPGWFVGPGGLRHSNALARFIRDKFNIQPAPYQETPPAGRSELDFWNVLQERDYTLESLYAEIEGESGHGQHQVILEDFAAILLSAIRAPAKNRQVESVCRYHRALAEALEPGDYVVNFNWDSLMADALLYCSPLWFPTTGFGIMVSRGRMREPRPKMLPIDSLVQLFHVHGSVCLFETETKPGTRKEFMYAGPRSDGNTDSLMSAAGIDLSAPDAQGGFSFDLPEDDERRLALGAILQGEGEDRKWFRPVFVPPSRDKGLDVRGYLHALRRQIHSVLPKTQRLLVAGYSFPAADTEHVRRLFPQAVIDPRLRLDVVNPSNDEDDFRSRVEGVFLPPVVTNYASKDFKEFCRALMDPRT